MVLLCNDKMFATDLHKEGGDVMAEENSANNTGYRL